MRLFMRSLIAVRKPNKVIGGNGKKLADFCDELYRGLTCSVFIVGIGLKRNRQRARNLF